VEETQDSALAAAVAAAAASDAAHGPYGHFPSLELRSEDRDGPTWAPDAEQAAALGPRLMAAFIHAHLVVFHPRGAGRDALRALLAAGFSTTEIVTLSQAIAFLSFQIRVVQGLRRLAG
jgi:CMD domain protein